MDFSGPSQSLSYVLSTKSDNTTMVLNFYLHLSDLEFKEQQKCLHIFIEFYIKEKNRNK